MTKKEQENIKNWQLYALNIKIQDWLSQQRHNTGNGSNDTAHSTDVCTDPHKTLTPDTRSIPTAMYDDTTLVHPHFRMRMPSPLRSSAFPNADALSWGFVIPILPINHLCIQ